MKKNYSLVYLDDGLSAAKSVVRYRQRRLDLVQHIGHAVCFTAIDNSVTADNLWCQVEQKIYQEPLFLYLTGINHQRGALFLDWMDGNLIEVLFLPTKNEKEEFWNGFAFSYVKNYHFKKKSFNKEHPQNAQRLSTLLGFSEVKALDELPQFIKAYLSQQKQKKLKLGLFWNEGKNSDDKKKSLQDANARFYDNLQKSFASHKKLATRLQCVNVARSTWVKRAVLDAVDIKHLKNACNWSVKIFIQLLRNSQLFSSEHHISAFLTSKLVKDINFSLSFSPMVASGSNAAVLHYAKNDDTIAAGELVLIDFGARCYTATADITRTIPANGKFNALQKMLYNIVLEAQEVVRRYAIAGVTINTLDQQVWSFIQKALRERFTAQGGKMKLFYKTKPHGVSHLIGNQVHDGDPFGVYKATPLQVGQVISNEPGIYGNFSIQLAGKRYDETIGIRIEDDLLITEQGCVNLTEKCPKKVAEIELLMQNLKLTSR